MAIETVRDNQWWYGDSELRAQVESALYVVLSIAGRECRLQHSILGSDGRVTRSFKFMDAPDRDYWRELSGQDVDIELLQAGDALPETDFAGDPDLVTERAAPDAPSKNLAEEIKRDGPTLFDAYIFVDWTASSTPKRGQDSIWIAEAAYGDNSSLTIAQPCNPSTRIAAFQLILERLLDRVHRKERILVGFDFPYGYPQGWNAVLGTGQGGWHELWNLLDGGIQDQADNSNNRWAFASHLNAQGIQGAAPHPGPYWGKPAAHIQPNLYSTKPRCFGMGNRNVVEYREIERRLRREGKRPKSVWQLLGNGSVGSQALLGIPLLSRLRNHELLRPCSSVWPLETGWQCERRNGPFVVHAEIWPGAINIDPTLHPVKDAAQMISYAKWAALHDTQGTLGARFDPFGGTVPPAQVVQTDEGWILR